MVAQFLLVRHGRMPGEYLKCPPGERILAKALYIDYMNRTGEANDFGD